MSFTTLSKALRLLLKLNLPEVYKVLQMLKFSVSGGHDGALFKMVMKLLDRSVKRDFQSFANRAL